MVNDYVMLEGSRIGAVEGEGGNANANANEIELSLELSIGGSYGKSKKLDADGEETGRTLSGSGEFGSFDSQAKREIQALRRQEARRKREGKLKKGNGYGSGGDRVKCVANENRVRVRNNEDGLVVGPASKREKIGNEIVGGNGGLIPVGPWQHANGFVNFYEGMTSWGAIGGNELKGEKRGLQSTGSRSFRPYQGSRNLEHNVGREGGLGNGSNVLPGRSSSDDQSSTPLGGNMSDNGSNSSYSQAKAQCRPIASEASHPPELSQHSGSSKQMESIQAVDSSADSGLNMVPSCVPQSLAIKPSEEPKSNTQADPADKPAPTNSNGNNGVADPEPNNSETVFRPRMPCVSTTGNGPNGKTVMGFLYRYTKTEVSIVCVCHGSSFSPAEFVEHAGGIDVVHPLRHITVIPSAL